jgi:predicted DCC family thiol-disulfide oxidoreductase YuxK
MSNAPSPADVLYYSRQCAHCQTLLPLLAKTEAGKSLRYVCVDVRRVDPATQQTHVFLENGQRVTLPPMIHSVPALLLCSQKYQVIIGDAILAHLGQAADDTFARAVQGRGEPQSFSFTPGAPTSITSDAYTTYDAAAPTPDAAAPSHRMNQEEMTRRMDQYRQNGPAEAGPASGPALPKLDARFFESMSAV